MIVINPNDCRPHIGVYTGAGASHSWMWFADILDQIGYYNVCFINENEIEAGALQNCDVFFVSGGDTFAIADALAGSAYLIEHFIKSGGTYVGTCAGAYLVMKSSLSPLDRFNFVNVQIVNLTKNLPVSLRKHDKFCTQYGCRYVFHPVRDEVAVRLSQNCDAEQTRIIEAPLYGGPAMYPSDDTESIAVFEDFTEKTEFLTNVSIARKTVLEKTAAAVSRYGKGVIYLFGPHFEHPAYADANSVLLNLLRVEPHASDTLADYSGMLCDDEPAGRKMRAFRKVLGNISNSRIAARGFEHTAYRWSIGRKVYDPEKILMFIEAVWKHARFIHDKGACTGLSAGILEQLIEQTDGITDAIRLLRSASAQSCSANDAASDVIAGLRRLSAFIYSLYFSIQMAAVDNCADICNNKSSKTKVTTNRAAALNR